MISYRKYNILIVALAITVLIKSSIAGAEDGKDTNSARSAGMKYFFNGMYSEAILEFEKVTGDRDYKLQEALITSYLKVGQFSIARSVALAIRGIEEYKPDNPNENLAKVFIDSLEDCNTNMQCCFERLMLAGKFAMELSQDNGTRRKVGIFEKIYAASFIKNSSGYNLLIKDAMHLLGGKNALSFEIEKIDFNTYKVYKVNFLNDDVISVFELEKGDYLTIIEVSNPSKVLKYNPEVAKALPADIGTEIKITKNMPLEFKAAKGETVIFKYEKK